MGKTMPADYRSSREISYQHTLPKAVPKTAEITRGQQLAQEAADRLRAAYAPIGELAVTPPEPSITEEERTVYITNPGHVPYLEN